MNKHDVSNSETPEQSVSADQLSRRIFESIEQRGLSETVASSSNMGESFLLGLMLVHLQRDPIVEKASEMNASRFKEMQSKVELKYNIK